MNLDIHVNATKIRNTCYIKSGLVLRYWRQLEDFTSDKKKHNHLSFVFGSMNRRFMGWPRSLLTDSGGFQMVSLLEVFSFPPLTSDLDLFQLAEITEEGVNFKSPYDDSM